MVVPHAHTFTPAGGSNSVLATVRHGHVRRVERPSPHRDPVAVYHAGSRRRPARSAHSYPFSPLPALSVRVPVRRDSHVIPSFLQSERRGALGDRCVLRVTERPDPGLRVRPEHAGVAKSINEHLRGDFRDHRGC